MGAAGRHDPPTERLTATRSAATGATTLTLCLAGDTMLGRGVGDVLRRDPRARLFSEEVIATARAADVFMLNLECCISARGEKWPTPGKPFFFRAPPAAVDVLVDLGVDCVTLANNHALDFGHDALVDTFDHLADAGIAWAGAGRDLAAARSPMVLTRDGYSLEVVAFTDHPRDYEATRERPGVAFADLDDGVPRWVVDAIARSEADAVLVGPHWGPNMTASPPKHVEAAADSLVRAGAAVIAGHSAHVFHGVRPPVLFDLGDFVDDYATDPSRRNDLGLLWVVTLEGTHLRRIEAVPLTLEYCYTRLATGGDRAWIERRFREACTAMGTEVDVDDGRLVVTP